MPKLKLPKAIKKVATDYAELAEKSKAISNSANRQKTVLRNAIKDHWTREQLPIGSYIHAGGMALRYEANETSTIDPEKVMALFENEEINREQFLRMIKINAAEAKNVLGGDQVADYTIKEVGSKLDVRIEALPVENVDDEFVMENHNVRTKRKRRVFGGITSTSKPRASTGKGKRKIRIKK